MADNKLGNISVHARLLESDSENNDENAALAIITTLQRKHKRLKLIVTCLSILCALQALLLSTIVVKQYATNRCGCVGDAAPSTANILDAFPSLAQSSAIAFQRRPFRARLHHNPFTGPPRPELDAAWHELFENIRIRVPQSDLSFYNLTSIPLSDGSGYAAELGVHHELHCLKKIRHYVHREYYLVNETEAEMVEWEAHIDHCVEYLREAIICRGDPSLSTFKWLPGKPNGTSSSASTSSSSASPSGAGRGVGSAHLTAVAEGHHQCVDWKRLMSWVRERAVPIFEPGVLVQPDAVGSVS